MSARHLSRQSLWLLALAALVGLADGCKMGRSSGDATVKDAEADAVAMTRDQQSYIKASNITLATSSDGGTTFSTDGHFNGFEAFAHTPQGVHGAEKMPAIFFRLLPELSALYDGPFKDPVKDFERYGFWRDPRFPQRDFPLGFTLSWPAPAPNELSYAIRTCGSCHTSRVRLGSGDAYTPIDGAANHELRLHAYNSDLQNWLVKATSQPGFKADVLRLVAEKHKQSTTYFFRGADVQDLAGQVQHMTETFEAEEIQRFTSGIDAALAAITKTAQAKLGGLGMLQTAYGANSKVDSSPAGIADTGGLGIAGMVSEAAAAVAADAAGKLPPQVTGTPSFQNVKKLFASAGGAAGFFFGNTKNKVPAVWAQGNHALAQWDGSLKNLLFRNLVAALGIAGKPDELDIPVNEVVSKFIEGLPAPRYPFPQTPDQQARVDSGRKHWDHYCAGCHVANMRDLVKNGGLPEAPIFTATEMHVDANREHQVPRTELFQLVRNVLLGVCQTPQARAAVDIANGPGRKPLVVRLSIDGKSEDRKPCDFEPSDLMIERSPTTSQGYLAKPLAGIWALAPYLHNGSVPTLRHLLDETIPRPDHFYTGLTRYDADNLGWRWSEADAAAEGDLALAKTVLVTTENGFANTGHTGHGAYKDFGARIPKSHVELDYKMSFSASAEDRAQLRDLLEFLKTL